MESLKIIYNIITLSTLIFSFFLLIFNFKKKIDHSIIIYVYFIHSMFDCLLWVFKKHVIFEKIFALDYDILFPIFIICLVYLNKFKKQIAIMVVVICLISIIFYKPFSQISISGYYKIGLSFIASNSLVLSVFKKLKKIKFKVFMLLLISAIPLIDMFYNASIFRYFTFEMHAWLIFLSTFGVYIIIIRCVYIYYYGKQLLKNPSPTI